jgi:hypothetical protein
VTFVRPCGDDLAHPGHTYSKRWYKDQLPNLRNPDSYPSSWLAQYECPGVEMIAWTVVSMHEDCAACEHCADLATETCLENGTPTETWRQVVPRSYPDGEFLEAEHWATVNRL